MERFTAAELTCGASKNIRLETVQQLLKL